MAPTPYEPYHFLKEFNEKFQMQIALTPNLSEVSTKLQTIHFFGEFNNNSRLKH